MLMTVNQWFFYKIRLVLLIRYTDGPTDVQTYRQTDRQTDRLKDRSTPTGKAQQPILLSIINYSWTSIDFLV